VHTSCRGVRGEKPSPQTRHSTHRLFTGPPAKGRKFHPKTAIELHTPDRSLQAPRPIATSTQTLSGKEVEALLATPAAGDPFGIDGTSGRVREPKVAR
jgi:hypothetical protein